MKEFSRLAAFRNRRGLVFIIALVLLIVSGCQSPPPSVNPGENMATALDFKSAITFRIEGGPIDEPATNDESLTLADAMQRALMSDPSIQAAMARVRIALADAEQARLWPNPILNLAPRRPSGGGSPIVEASLAQDFIAILMVGRKSSAADSRLRHAAAESVVVALDVAAELQQRYASVQALDELAPVFEHRITQVKKLAGLADARLEAGEGTRQDVTVLTAQTMELTVELAAIEQDRRDERLRLSRLIGEPAGAAKWRLDPWTPVVPNTAPESAWIDAALQQRPEIQVVEWELAALGDDVALAHWFPFEGTSAGAKAERDDGWSIGPEVSAPIPVFDMGQARAARLTAQQIEARHELTQARRLVVEDVRRAYESVARSQSNLHLVREELIPLQRQRRSHAEALFRAGEDVTSLFLAEQDLQAAEARAVELERQTTLAHVRLQRAVGGAGVANRISAASDGPLSSNQSGHSGSSSLKASPTIAQEIR